MVCWIDGADAAFHAFCSRDAFGTRLSALHRTYSGAAFARFFAQKCGTEYTAVLGGIDGDFALCAGENADFTELALFMRTAGYETLLCDAAILKHLGLSESASGPIFYYAQQAQNAAITPQLLEQDALRDAYSLLLLSGFTLPPFGDWLADVAARQRTNASAVYGIYADGRLDATMSLLFQTQQAAFLGALATRKESRGHGYGGAMVSFLAESCRTKGQRCALFCRDGGIARFYQKQGFLPQGRWAEHKIGTSR